MDENAQTAFTGDVCRAYGCPEDAIEAGLCEWHVRVLLPRKRRPRAAPGLEFLMRTCTEVEGCDEPTCSSRGPYANVCWEHRHIVTERMRARGASGTTVRLAQNELERQRAADAAAADAERAALAAADSPPDPLAPPPESSGATEADGALGGEGSPSFYELAAQAESAAQRLRDAEAAIASARAHWIQTRDRMKAALDSVEPRYVEASQESEAA